MYAVRVDNIANIFYTIFIPYSLFGSKRFFEAINLSQRLADNFVKVQNRHSFNKQALTTVIIALVLGDSVEAGKRLANFGG
jgi:hypothetical protein